MSCSPDIWESSGPVDRFDQFQSIITPGDGNSLNIAETIDYNTRGQDQHGILLEIPTDFGHPENIRAASSDASDQLEVQDRGSYVEVKVGDPDVTFKGTARYEIDYRLPEAPTALGEVLSVDLFGDIDLEMDRVRGVLSGFKLDHLECFHGKNYSRQTCELIEIEPYVYEVQLEDIKVGDYVTIGGVVAERVPPPAVQISDLDTSPTESDRVNVERALLGLLGATFGGSIAAFAVYLWMRRGGRNIVAGGSPAEAAFAVGAPADEHQAEATTRSVSDPELLKMATTEFVPPPGIAPWEGGLLLTEQFGDTTLNNYVSGLAGTEVIEIRPLGLDLSITQGPNYDSAPIDDRRWADAVLSIANPYVTGFYSQRFAEVMETTKAELWTHTKQSGWWRRGPNRRRNGKTSLMWAGLRPIWRILLLLLLFILFGVLLSNFGLVGRPWSWKLMSIIGVLAGGIAAAIAYRPLFPSLTAAGSALALRTESFRRFLHHSEAQHVEWAWKQGVLREYSAWAVALGEAKAWNSALSRSSVPPEYGQFEAMGHAFLGRSIAQSLTRPSSSGSGGSSSGGGGFRGGGSAGGGGGGGRRGSW